MPSWQKLIFLLLALISTMPIGGLANRISNVYWNSSNPIFRIDNTDHIIDVNTENIPFKYDQVNIICPVYSRDSPEEEAEKYIIYIVRKEEYDSCRITTPAPRVIAVCDKPYKLMYFTITFRSFTPQPGGLEFKPGEDYYFISTSSKHDLYRRIGGQCSSNNMKVVFKVCCNHDSKPVKDQANNQISNIGWPVLRGTTTTTPFTFRTTPRNRIPKTNSSTSLITSPKNPPYKIYPTKTTTKKVETYSADDRRTNEVVQSKLGGASGASQIHCSMNLYAMVLLGVLGHFIITNNNFKIKWR